MNGQEGTEAVAADGTHQIDYLSAGADEDRFEGRTLDFYALTYGNTTLPYAARSRWRTGLRYPCRCRECCPTCAVPY